MNSPRGIDLMRDSSQGSGDIQSKQLKCNKALQGFTLSKNLPNTHKVVITRFLSYNPNEENLLATLMGNRFSATIVKNPSQIMHMTVYDTLSRCTEQGVKNHIPNRHGSR